MKIPQALALGAALTLPIIGAGCNKENDIPESPRRNVWEENRNESLIQKRINAEMEKRKEEVSPLEHYRHTVPGIHLFDKNKNNILEPNEIDLFINVVINKDGKYSGKNMHKLFEVHQALENIGLIHTDRGNYYPNNITTTLENLHKKYIEYGDKVNPLREFEQRIQAEEEEIRNSLKKLEK